jgi:hypothetical protein
LEYNSLVAVIKLSKSVFVFIPNLWLQRWFATSSVKLLRSEMPRSTFRLLGSSARFRTD